MNNYIIEEIQLKNRKSRNILEILIVNMIL